MDEKQLQEIEARASAATPGPWAVGTWAEHMGDAGLPSDVYTADEDDHQDTVVSFHKTYHKFLDIDPGGAAHADAAFIAQARADSPALAAEVRRLRALVEEGYREGFRDGSDEAANYTLSEHSENFGWRKSDAAEALGEGE